MASSALVPAKDIKNYEKSLKLLEQGAKEPNPSPIVLAGIIKAFEMAYELSWKGLRTLLKHHGITANSPREVFVQAYSLSLIDDEMVWLSMIKDRNETVHTYNEAFAKAMAHRIEDRYLPAFRLILKRLQQASTAEPPDPT